MKFIGIIPARYASTRFPAKPLAVLGGKPVIQRVYEQVAGVLDEAYVATDVSSILQVCPKQEYSFFLTKLLQIDFDEVSTNYNQQFYSHGEDS